MPEKDARTEIRTTVTRRALAKFTSLEEWQKHAARVRQQTLASAGLLPFPKKTPLKPKFVSRTKRDGYTVENVYFQSYPGVLVCGNLYRPTGKKGPFPAVLSPHGHWHHGRLEHTEIASIPGRCINLALQGYVVFAYDMVGYNDSKLIPHRQLGGQREQLWGISLMGLHLWNSIRAIDFVRALPEVDAGRIACTGASGGGTQTFLLAAVDDRITVAAPVNMIAAHNQGGCICENGPNLRLDTTNLEIGALCAPRPLLLISATGDWTKDTPKVEFPWIRDIYKLFGAEKKVANAHIDAGHNYNRDSREAAYAWFARWMKDSRAKSGPKEVPFFVERPPDSLVFHGRPYPCEVVDAATLIQNLIQQSKAQLQTLWPKDRAGLRRFRRTYAPVFQAALAPGALSTRQIVAREGKPRKHAGFTIQPLTLGRKGKGDCVPAVLLTPENAKKNAPAALLVHGKGKAQIVGKGKIHPLASRLLKSGRVVLAIDCFGLGEAGHGPRPEAAGFFTTYNKTEIAERVQDILTAIGYLASKKETASVELVGLGEAGLWCLLARALTPIVSACVLDMQNFDLEADASFVKKLYVPLLRRAGDLRTAVALAAPQRLFFHNTGRAFDTRWIERLYAALGRRDDFTADNIAATAKEIAAFLAVNQ